MPRDIDEKKTRKALRKLRKARDRAESEGGPGLTEWEQEFVEGVEERLNTYGSGFSDPEKGALDEALSARQSQIVKQIDKKARGKGMKRSSFKSKTPQRSSGRDINEDAPPETVEMPVAPEPPRLVQSGGDHQPTPRPSAGARPALRVIEGGKG